MKMRSSPRRDRLELEFGCYALWLAQVINEFELDPIPVACRGTGNPELFERLAGALGLRRESRLLDLGSGLGGPARWLSGHTGCEVVGVEIMESSAQGARLLFPTGEWVVADSGELPFENESFDAAWALGALETIDDKDETLAEVHRVLRPGARLAVYTFVPTSSAVTNAPMADRFEPRDTLVQRMRRASFEIVEARCVPELGVSARSWREQLQTVRAEVERRHNSEPVFRRCREELDKMSALWRSGEVLPWQFVIQKRGGAQ